MAKLPPVDLTAIWAKDHLHYGRRAEALAVVEKAVASGKAGAETLALAKYLASAKRGRQPFGRKHLWYEIGRADDVMKDAGLSYDDRIEKLKEFGLATREDIAKALSTYAKAMAEIQEINRQEQAADLNTRHE